MVGTSSYKRDQIQHILRMRRESKTNQEIVASCKEAWPDKVWETKHITYIVGKYTNDENYQLLGDSNQPPPAQRPKAKPRAKKPVNPISITRSPPVRKPLTRTRKQKKADKVTKTMAKSQLPIPVGESVAQSTATQASELADYLPQSGQNDPVVDLNPTQNSMGGRPLIADTNRLSIPNENTGEQNNDDESIAQPQGHVHTQPASFQPNGNPDFGYHAGNDFANVQNGNKVQDFVGSNISDFDPIAYLQSLGFNSAPYVPVANELEGFGHPQQANLNFAPYNPSANEFHPAGNPHVPNANVEPYVHITDGLEGFGHPQYNSNFDAPANDFHPAGHFQVPNFNPRQYIPPANGFGFGYPQLAPTEPPANSLRNSSQIQVPNANYAPNVPHQLGYSPPMNPQAPASYGDSQRSLDEGYGQDSDDNWAGQSHVEAFPGLVDQHLQNNRMPQLNPQIGDSFVRGLPRSDDGVFETTPENVRNNSLNFQKKKVRQFNHGKKSPPKMGKLVDDGKPKKKMDEEKSVDPHPARKNRYAPNMCAVAGGPMRASFNHPKPLNALAMPFNPAFNPTRLQQPRAPQQFANGEELNIPYALPAARVNRPIFNEAAAKDRSGERTPTPETTHEKRKFQATQESNDEQSEKRQRTAAQMQADGEVQSNHEQLLQFESQGGMTDLVFPPHTAPDEDRDQDMRGIQQNQHVSQSELHQMGGIPHNRQGFQPNGPGGIFMGDGELGLQNMQPFMILPQQIPFPNFVGPEFGHMQMPNPMQAQQANNQGLQFPGHVVYPIAFQGNWPMPGGQTIHPGLLPFGGNAFPQPGIPGVLGAHFLHQMVPQGNGIPQSQQHIYPATAPQAQMMENGIQIQPDSSLEMFGNNPAFALDPVFNQLSVNQDSVRGGGLPQAFSWNRNSFNTQPYTPNARSINPSQGAASVRQSADFGHPQVQMGSLNAAAPPFAPQLQLPIGTGRYANASMNIQPVAGSRSNAVNVPQAHVPSHSSVAGINPQPAIAPQQSAALMNQEAPPVPLLTGTPPEFVLHPRPSRLPTEAANMNALIATPDISPRQVLPNGQVEQPALSTATDAGISDEDGDFEWDEENGDQAYGYQELAQSSEGDHSDLDHILFT